MQNAYAINKFSSAQVHRGSSVDKFVNNSVVNSFCTISKILNWFQLYLFEISFAFLYNSWNEASPRYKIIKTRYNRKNNFMRIKVILYFCGKEKIKKIWIIIHNQNEKSRFEISIRLKFKFLYKKHILLKKYKKINSL